MASRSPVGEKEVSKRTRQISVSEGLGDGAGSSEAPSWRKMPAVPAVASAVGIHPSPFFSAALLPWHGAFLHLFTSMFTEHLLVSVTPFGLGGDGEQGDGLCSQHTWQQSQKVIADPQKCSDWSQEGHRALRPGGSLLEHPGASSSALLAGAGATAHPCHTHPGFAHIKPCP